MSYFSMADFKIWLKENRRKFFMQNYTPHQVAHLAILAGFDPADIFRTLIHFQDAMEGTDIDKRVDFAMRTELAECERRSKVFDLDEQWHALYHKQKHDTDFKEAA